MDLRFFRRSDALYEVEGRLIDTKTHPFRRMLAEKEPPPSQHLHDITVRLVLDSDLLVHAEDAVMPATPFSICPGAARTLEPLVGLSIGAGWNKRVRELLRGAASCTHIVELLGPMATTAIQGLAPQRAATIGDPGNDAAKTRLGGQLLRIRGGSGGCSASDAAPDKNKSWGAMNSQQGMYGQ